MAHSDGAERRSLLAGDVAPNIYSTTIDPAGRLALREAAEDVSWQPRLLLGLTLVDGVVRLRRLADPDAPDGPLVAVELDEHHRVVVPWALGLMHNLQAGARVVVVSNPSTHAIAAAPLLDLVSRLTGSPASANSGRLAHVEHLFSAVVRRAGADGALQLREHLTDVLRNARESSRISVQFRPGPTPRPLASGGGS